MVGLISHPPVSPEQTLAFALTVVDFGLEAAVLYGAENDSCVGIF